jgi:hypothetical protein
MITDIKNKTRKEESIISTLPFFEGAGMFSDE